MTSSRFKTAIFNGVEELTAAACLDIARRSTSRSDIDVTNVTMTKFSDIPVGFLGDHYKVIITVRYQVITPNDGNKVATCDLPLFVKTKPRSEIQTNLLESFGVFEKERLFFTTLLVLLKKFMGEVDEPWLPKCLFTSQRLIVLEDLSNQGFKILENRAVMDYDHLVKMFRTLATFHASSIVAEELEGRRLGRAFRLDEEYPEVFQESLWTRAPGNPGFQIVTSGIKALVTLSKLMPELSRGTPTLAEVLAKYLTEEMFDEISGLVGRSTEFRNVATHGDLWQNNVLFRYNASTRPVASRLVDFQQLRYTPPAHDFLIALWLNSTRTLRRLHFDDLARVYHSALAACLARHSLDAEALCGWTEFETSLRRYHVLGLVTSSLYFQTVLLPENVATELFADGGAVVKLLLEDRSVAATKSFAEDAVYRERLEDAVEELAAFVAERAEGVEHSSER